MARGDASEPDRRRLGRRGLGRDVQGGADGADGARDGQGPRGGRRGRPGSDRHDVLHGRRGAAAVRPDDAVGAARQVHDERPDAGRGRRGDHAVELPDRDPELEDRAGARLRRHGRLQAGRGHAASSSSRSSRRRACPRACSTSCTARGRWSANASSSTRRCRSISFTGSREVGAGVLAKAAPQLKNVHLELGGKNAIIVMDDADLELAVDGILWSAFGTSGQRCTAASRVIATARVYDDLAVRARLACGEAAPRQRPRARHRRRARHQPRSAREDPRLHANRARGGREAADRRRAGNGRRARRRAPSTAPPCSRRSSPACESPRRRSSGRRPR